MSTLVGQQLGQYTVLEQIGQGGMARVFKGYQTSLEREVAIKAIPAEVDDAVDNQFVKRFNDEARLIAKLTHPNIVPVHDYGEDKGWAFIVMEYISGGTLRGRIVPENGQHRPLELPRMLDLLAQAALALQCAHEHGVIHRDVKPANMLLRTNDHLLLSDFGIAAILEANRAFTRSGANAGTPHYMAPEQGIPNAPIDARTDIYALGVVVFQAVTGRLPFTGDSSLSILMKHVNEPVPRPSSIWPGIPVRLEQIILRAMEKNPAARFQQASEMAAQLKEAASEARRAPRPPQVTLRRDGQPVPVIMPPGPRGVPGAPGTCQRCGVSNNPKHRFCTTCGYDLTGARARNDHYLLPNGHPLRCRLTFRNGPLAGQTYLLHQDITTIGRIAGNDIVILDGSVSRNHAKLSFQKGHWLIEDLHSTNHTFVNGAEINRPVPVQHGDELRFGDAFAIFELVG